MNKPIQQAWTFQSESNPKIEYQTLQYGDGTKSCDCKGWTRRVASDGSRSCKHCRWVDMGTADQHSTSSHDYRSPVEPVKTQTKAAPLIGFGKRKIILDP